MAEYCIAAIFWNFYDVVSNMAENVKTKRAVVVPLGADTIDANLGVIAKPKYMPVWRHRMNAVSTVHLFSSPKLTCKHLFGTSHHSLTTKNKKASISHFFLQSLKYLQWWTLRFDIYTFYSCTHRFNGRNVDAMFF